MSPGTYAMSRLTAIFNTSNPEIHVHDLGLEEFFTHRKYTVPPLQRLHH